MHVHVLFKNKTTIPNYLCLLHIQKYHYQKKLLMQLYMQLLKNFWLYYTNTQTNKKTGFKSSFLTSVSSSQCPSNSSDAIIT